MQPHKVYQAVPFSSSIVQGLNRTGDNERESVTKLNHIAFQAATKGLLFNYFKDEIELQKLHVKFQARAYENESACRDFILNISNFLFDKLVREKLSRVNFFAILCDGSTDHSITEQEVVYVAYDDPDSFQPCLKFFHLVSPKDSQDARSLKECILSTFEDHGMKDLIPNMVFLASDGALVNSGKNSGIIRLLQEDFPWVSFIWCFSLQLELALKDALKDFIDPVDESLCHLFYMYKKSSKKVRELKNLHNLLKEQFEMFGSNIRPTKAAGTRWIDH